MRIFVRNYEINLSNQAVFLTKTKTKFREILFAEVSYLSEISVMELQSTEQHKIRGLFFRKLHKRTDEISSNSSTIRYLLQRFVCQLLCILLQWHFGHFKLFTSMAAFNLEP